MGDFGLPTRVLAARFGSAWIYAGGLGSIGQLTPTTLLEDIGSDRSASTDVYGLVGLPVGHSCRRCTMPPSERRASTPSICPCQPRTPTISSLARAIGLRGASVTIPFKAKLFEHMDESGPVARRIGAITRSRGGWPVAGREH
jgi:hypothetical protein